MCVLWRTPVWVISSRLVSIVFKFIFRSFLHCVEGGVAHAGRLGGGGVAPALARGAQPAHERGGCRHPQAATAAAAEVLDEDFMDEPWGLDPFDLWSERLNERWSSSSERCPRTTKPEARSFFHS